MDKSGANRKVGNEKTDRVEGHPRGRARLPVVRSREKSDGQTLICFGGIETHPDLFCGGCGALLAGGTLLSDIGHDALKCNACGSFNIAS